MLYDVFQFAGILCEIRFWRKDKSSKHTFLVKSMFVCATLSKKILYVLCEKYLIFTKSFGSGSILFV